VVFAAQTYTTPDVLVPMGTHDTKELTGPGSVAPATRFTLGLSNCPAGLNSIQYRIDPATSVTSSTQSVVALDGGSTAKGMGLQLLDNQGVVLPLKKFINFSDYDKSTGGSYSIPLQARYYQTDSAVTAGSANTSVYVTMSYQ
jgi:major type 1 subunit fimbrin (pilin)